MTDFPTKQETQYKEHIQKKVIIIRKILSYRGLIPSSDFNEDEYFLYLQYASAEELENDIVSEKTYLKMVYDGNWNDDDEEIVDDKIRMRYF